MADVRVGLRGEAADDVYEGGTIMNGTAVDPRDVAQALDMDTLDLARVLTKYASNALPRLDFDSSWEPPSLDSFDENVGRARNLLVSAHEAMAAWNLDNPPDPDGE